MAAGVRYSIQELADLGDISRRTVRYYVQEGLIPPPTGVGRGRHYDQTHLDRLLEVKARQASGHSLDEIRSTRAKGPRTDDRASTIEPLPRPSMWRRIVVTPGVEIHVASGVRLPGPGRLRELSDWCRTLFVHPEDDEVDHAD